MTAGKRVLDQVITGGKTKAKVEETWKRSHIRGVKSKADAQVSPELYRTKEQNHFEQSDFSVSA